MSRQHNISTDDTDNAVQNEIAQMNIRRGQIKCQLTKFQSFLNEDNGKNKTHLKLRKEKIEKLWDEFDNVQSKIEAKDSSADQLAYRDGFVEMYFELMAIAEDRLKNVSEVNKELSIGVNTISDVNREIHDVSKSIKLKPLEIPMFNGSFDDWTAFQDMFTSLVHENENLTKVQKFHYLKTSVSGEALKIIKNLETSEINYTAAWKIITDRYDNKRLLIQSHTKSIYDLPHMREESADKMRQFTNTLNQHRQALQALGHDPDNWGALLLHVITSKMDSNTLRQWETINAKKELPEVQEIIEYLHDRCQVLEAVESAKGKNEKSKQFPRKIQSYVSETIIKCYLCQGQHPMYKCAEFLKMGVEQRIKKVSEMKICSNCFRNNHRTDQCRARKCIKCNLLHNSLLHKNKINGQFQAPRNNMNSNNLSNTAIMAAGETCAYGSEQTSSAIVMSSISENVNQLKTNRQVLLATAVIEILGKDNTWYTCRALMDSGSQSNFVTDEMMKKLCLSRKRVNYPITGVAGSKHNAEYELTITLRSRINSFKLTRQALVLRKITGKLPATTCEVLRNNIPENINLADPYFYKQGKIDMLIGADAYWDIMGNNIVRLSSTGPFLQETKLGWIVAGGTVQGSTVTSNSCMMVCTNHDMCLSEKLEMFWKTEECPAKEIWSNEEKQCAEHFIKNTRRDEKGKFIVKLPLKNNVNNLGRSYQTALRRFLSLERRLIKNPEIYNQYKNFMQVYFELGHMEEVVGEEINRDGCDCVYIPHSYVINENSRTTKLRVVFDASSKTDTGLSLNDVLMKGPVIQEDLIKIIARFRTHKYAFSGDVTKMYRQIWIDKSHRNYQRIVWRFNNNDTIKIYRLCTVTYGTVSASFQAIKCLSVLSEECNDVLISNIIKHDFCVDDCLTGGSTIQEAIYLRNTLITTLSKAGFTMAKWTANNSKLLENIPGVDSNTCMSLDLGAGAVKTVGVFWEPRDDNLSYNIKESNISIYTKRNILACIASLFDPLGLVGPVLVVAKIIMQSLWLEKVDWDETLSEKICKQWEKFWNELKNINKIKIPRWLNVDTFTRVEVHGFADASSHAYGACLYLRTETVDGKITVKLICAKSRVAPLKNTTIPRLELCAAVLLARLSVNIIPTLRVNISEQYWWSDSQVVLAWIRAESSRWKTYVANRIGEIHEVTKKQDWYYVKSNENPADMLSRGCTPTVLKNSDLWWHGPKWLHKLKNDNEYLCSEDSNNNKNILKDVSIEEKESPVVVTATIKSEELFIFNRYSSWRKLLRVVAYILRFYNNALCKKRNTSLRKGLLCVNEIQLATMTLIKIIQKYAFAAEINNLQNIDKDGTAGKRAKGRLSTLNPFLDTNGILRVGGRLINAANITYEQKHQIILPYIEPFSSLYFRHEHERLLHAGPQAMLASIQLQYWPIKGRNTAKKVVHNCINCFKLKPVTLNPIMGNLPKYRIEKPSRCFETCGVDYAGPVCIKSNKRRNATINKAYICIFICFATKAIHIELVYELTTDGFIAALKRFISRRGICKHIYSDNATNFVGANRKLNELKTLWSSEEHNEKVRSFFNDNFITWHFIPPRSPHFGGLWEAAVKSVKKHLNRTIAATKLTYDEMYTVLVQIEACLNSRPLVPLSSDPNDLAIITPAHFLIGSSLLALPQIDQSEKNENYLSRWERIQKITQGIWKRWQMEYLNQLQVRAKWGSHGMENISVGTMVLVKESNVPPLHWCLGRIVSVYPGNDGVIRVVDINTRNGIKKRAVRLVCPLPGQNQRDHE